MKRSSIKLRLTLWYTLLMLLMAAVTLTFVMAISSSVANQTVLDSLDRTLRENALQADIVDGELEIGQVASQLEREESVEEIIRDMIEQFNHTASRLADIRM